VAQGAGYSFFLTPDSLMLSLTKATADANAASGVALG
jgi:hypothetical protein